MAKIICITSGLTGILNASFELVARLQADGHQVLYAAPIKVGEKVQRQGIPFIQLPAINVHPGPKIPAFSGPLKKWKGLFYKIKNRSERRKKALENTEPFALSKLLDAEQPDLVLVDVELHEYIFKLYKKNIPLLLLSQWFSLWKRPGLPYLLHDTIPGSGWKGQAWAIAFSWRMIRIRRWWTFFKQKLYTVFTDRRTILLDLAKKDGFPLAYLKENNWPGPFTYDQLPVLSMTAKELEFPHSFRPNLFYIGPMVNPNRTESKVSDELKKKLQKIFEKKRKENAALIYCSVSTLHQGDHRFIKKLISAVIERKDWLLIIGMGGLIKEAQFEDLPSNVFAFSYVPQLQVLQEADCSINHGGIHTINECIHYQVPMLVYSGKRSDQNGCAARVAYHGLGIMADKDKDDAYAIHSKIAIVLGDATFREKMSQVHQKYLQYKKDRHLEKIVDQFLSPQMNIKEKLSI